MTERDKIAHLLRRFGLGAGDLELRAYEPLGVQGTLDRLLDYEKIEPGFELSPWEFCFEENSNEVYLDPFRTLGYWCLRLQFTRRPLEEKLTLFWHDHFGVSAAKVEFGPMMLAHLESLRRHAAGRFETLLLAVARDPAMIRFLDTDENRRGAPNENFSRELLELFTLGIGSYSEKDVRETARAFAGWGNRFLVFERGGEKLQETARECMRTGQPMVAFCLTPDLQDGGQKTILGQTGAFSGEDVIRMLCARPETARHICRKLWEWFAYPSPEPAPVEALASVFQESSGDIRKVLRALAARPEFWSERCVRNLPKSPVDFTIAITRQSGANEFLLALRPKGKDPLEPLPKALRDVAGMLAGLMSQQGMLLLYPPDVDGWEWGEDWLTEQALAIRARLGEMLMGVGQQDKGLAALLASRIVRDRNPQSAAEVVDGILSVFDGKLGQDKTAILVEACQKQGGPASLRAPETASPMLGTVLKLLFATPEFQHA
jgi:uncharacterized protein (DUF1800 family)